MTPSIHNSPVLHNFSLYLLSDADNRRPLWLIVAVLLCVLFSKLGTPLPAPTSEQWDEITSRLMPERALRLVVERKPVPFIRNGFHKDYPEQSLAVYVVEVLECGHRLEFHPQVDLLIAKRRVCPDCSSLSVKKPAGSVRLMNARAA